jgi:hypothetical protein
MSEVDLNSNQVSFHIEDDRSEIDTIASNLGK